MRGSHFLPHHPQSALPPLDLKGRGRIPYFPEHALAAVPGHEVAPEGDEDPEEERDPGVEQERGGLHRAPGVLAPVDVLGVVPGALEQEAEADAGPGREEEELEERVEGSPVLDRQV